MNEVALMIPGHLAGPVAAILAGRRFHTTTETDEPVRQKLGVELFGEADRFLFDAEHLLNLAARRQAEEASRRPAQELAGATCPGEDEVA